MTTHSLRSVAIIMDILNDTILEYLLDLNENKPPELIEFEHQVCKANYHFSTLRNDVISWYLSPPESCSYPKLAKKTNVLLNSQFCIIPTIVQRTYYVYDVSVMTKLVRAILFYINFYCSIFCLIEIVYFLFHD